MGAIPLTRKNLVAPPADEQDASRPAAVSGDPNAAGRAGGPALPHDEGTYRMVVSFLGLTVIVVLAGCFVLASLRIPIPEILVPLGSAALGAIAGLLTPVPIKR